VRRSLHRARVGAEGYCLPALKFLAARFENDGFETERLPPSFGQLLGEAYTRPKPSEGMGRDSLPIFCGLIQKTKVFETAPAVRLKGLADAQFALRGCNDRA
jgi:hypothetical protein